MLNVEALVWLTTTLPSKRRMKASAQRASVLNPLPRLAIQVKECLFRTRSTLKSMQRLLTQHRRQLRVSCLLSNRQRLWNTERSQRYVPLQRIQTLKPGTSRRTRLRPRNVDLDDASGLSCAASCIDETLLKKSPKTSVPPRTTSVKDQRRPKPTMRWL